ncbi:penicillin-binding protein, beta-lactamase class C [Herbaspirillum sp. CF444]|nr:penicillin-binding protein, beta-lactamase class C [Herbaspirillum sp. CF444]
MKKSCMIVLALVGATLMLSPIPSPSVALPAERNHEEQSFPGKDWSRASPESQGFSQPGIDRALAYAKNEGSTAGLVIVHGLVMAEWGDIARKSNLHSARKSFMSALVGIAVSRGQLSLDATLQELGIDDETPSLTSTEKQATVRMLLQARSGIYHPTVYETAGMKASRPQRYSHDPGTFWYYNNWDFNTIGAIYEKATGERIFDAIKVLLADPLNMQDYLPSDGRYVGGGFTTRYPAYPFNMSARDLARFALLYLHRGRWRDQQIVPANWVDESTRPYSDTSTGGYGYMWWTSMPAHGQRTKKMALLRPTFWADGHLGQYAVVVPSLDLVVVNLVDARLTSKHMGQSQMEELMWLVEHAAGVPDIGSEPGRIDLSVTPTQQN